jgi:uncharacterized protein (DUF1501 family)
MSLTRREILQALAVAGAGGLLPVAGLSGLAFAAERNAAHPLLLVLHLRGGCDGLNLISPANDGDFIAARAAELRVSAEGTDAGFSLANSPDAHTDFRLHASAGGLAELYKEGHLAFIHAAGLTNATRSHFVATDMIEHGVASETDLARTPSGWLARAVGSNAVPTTFGIRAIAAGGIIGGDLAELDDVLAVPDLTGGLASPGGPKIGAVLQQLYATAAGEAALAGRKALQLMATVDGKLARDPQGHVLPYLPQDGVKYDAASDFARPLKVVAQLIKMDLGLEAATLDLANWDTHEGQPGRFRSLTERLSNGLAAFWNDMAPYHDRMTVVMMSEFGRRLRGNKSGGTDHGRAGVMAVLGGRVKGGRIYGAWPGLQAAKLDEGVDLAVTTDYRRVLTEVLDNRQGTRANHWFQGYEYPGPLGLFG